MKASVGGNTHSGSKYPWRPRTFEKPDKSIVIACLPSHNGAVPSQRSALGEILSKVGCLPFNDKELEEYSRKLSYWNPKFDGTEEESKAEVSVMTREDGARSQAWLKCTATFAQAGEEDKVPMLWKLRKSK